MKGRDDQRYIDLMGYYKHVARKTQPSKIANKYLKKAMKIAREGDVSSDARLAAAYI
jgi:hypothetical protein